MDLEYRATELFAAHVEAVTAAAALAPRLAQAAHRLTDTFLQGGKVLCAGGREGLGLARQFARQMLHCHERERLGLPALMLDPCVPAADGDPAQHMIQQLAALGRAGDLLLLVEPSAEELARLRPLPAAARQREIPVLLLCDAAAETDPPGERDLLLPVPGDSPARVLEVQQLALHVLCDLIDTQLLGSH